MADLVVGFEGSAESCQSFIGSSEPGGWGGGGWGDSWGVTKRKGGGSLENLVLC